MRRRIGKFKNGAASFYVVAFSTLILVIIAASFATAIVAEITRSSNDDLSQSAYDAALAGVEDAKLAFSNYKSCADGEYPDNLSSGADITCQDIMYWVNHPDCDMVAHILGRIAKDESGEVLVEETTSMNGSSANNMNQAYTCTMLQMSLDDYRATLSSSNPYRVLKAELEDVDASQIVAVRVNWYSDREGTTRSYTNLTNVGSNKFRATFQPLSVTKASVPPTLAVQLIQTAQNFTIEQVNSASDGDTTDRAMVYLVPTDNATAAATSQKSYSGVYNGEDNVVTASQLVSTNDHIKDVPYAVYCPNNPTSEYACSALLQLPSPIGGTRSNDTFVFVVSLPYAQPDTDFSLEFICADGAPCNEVAGGEADSETVAKMNGMQIMIDSTGRANDLYRRVEVRLESADNNFAYPFYTIQLLGKDGSGTSLKKNLTVTTEYGL